MAITAKTSHKLHQTLGDEAAEDVVNWMQQADSNRLELRELNELNYARLDSRFDAFEARFDAFEVRFNAFESRFDLFEARVDARFDASDARTDAKLAALEARIDARFGDLRLELSGVRLELHDAIAGLNAKVERRFSDLLKWSFVFWIGTIGAIVLTRVLK